MADSLTISMEQCYSAYKELNHSLQAQRHSAESESQKDLGVISSILSHFGAIVHPIPKNETQYRIWLSELHRLQAAFGRMKKGMPSRRFVGTFYNSKKFCSFATQQVKVVSFFHLCFSFLLL